jgi:uncharacterized protein (TIGR00730 family)
MNIAVFCSSSNQIPEHYTHAARQLGEWIAQNGHKLIYGGGTGGLMDAVASGAKANGGEIIGIIPKSIIRMKRQSSLPSEIIVVNTMSERKAGMQKHSDVFVVLPGGYGTLDEMFDVITAGIVGEHQKKTIMVNEGGFYTSLITQIDEMRSKAFIPKNENYKPIIAKDIHHCIELIKE